MVHSCDVSRIGEGAIKDVALGVLRVVMSVAVTWGLFLGSPRPDDGMWWCLFTGPPLAVFGVWMTRTAWRDWRRSPRPAASGRSALNARRMAELTYLVGADGGFTFPARIRDIGAEIDREGGFDFMQAYYVAVRACGGYFFQDFWDGIGNWRK
ncbi:hypothetical protein [Urbifossiella limnaea]|uniref:hypothetical protein n=1 Tax=Urbifossiella limnaea TaxID=2528023 RepID=UPI0011A3516F|nr:hypothetical protein [Urbifossiella limnaea]